MPNVVVTCTFNPPAVSIQGASIRQDTIDALQKALPKRTTTSQPTQRSEPPKFLMIGGPEATGAASPDSNKYTNWKIDLGQHYCDQKGRSMINLAVMEALEEEGFCMRGVHTINVNEKDVTRMIFSRAAA